MKRKYLLTVFIFFHPFVALSDDATYLPQVVVTTSKEAPKNDPMKFVGPIYVMPSQQIKDKQTNDVNRLLRDCRKSKFSLNFRQS